MKAVIVSCVLKKKNLIFISHSNIQHILIRNYPYTNATTLFFHPNTIIILLPCNNNIYFFYFGPTTPMSERCLSIIAVGRNYLSLAHLAGQARGGRGGAGGGGDRWPRRARTRPCPPCVCVRTHSSIRTAINP